jgi:hypothetical protein
MSFTYAWALTSLKKANVNDLSGVIIQTHWTCTGTDEDGNEGVFSGATPFNPAEVDPDNYTAYEDLTEAQVLGWIEGVVTTTYWDHVEGQIAKQVDAKKAQVEDVADGQFPWSAEGEAA